MTSTPPPPSARAHTPPTPLHGARYDTYEPYSPRRSRRSTAHNNPYSSFNSERSPRVVRADASTPPATVKKARLVRDPTQLSSPPSSPVSPALHLSPRYTHKTPRKQLFSSAKPNTVVGVHSDSDTPLRAFPASTMHPVAMLPTPSKTPKKRQSNVASTARILNFQPNDPNDVMPTPRKMGKSRHNRLNGFELYEDDLAPKADRIEIFTDANARIPELDGSEDNPFIGAKKNERNSQRRVARVSRARRERDAQIDDAVKRDEGVAYVFRGRKIFRRFEDGSGDDTSEAGTEISRSSEQQALRKQAGAAAQRPLTRSAIKPRLLFPSEEQLRERELADDEEAITDIDTPITDAPASESLIKDATTPLSKRFNPVSPPPTTNRTMRSANSGLLGIPETPELDHDEMDPMSLTNTFAGQPQKRVKRNSPFDSWQRTKTGRKRTGDEAPNGANGGKRARSAALESPT